MTWQDTYGRVTGAFGTKGPFYGPQGHRGADYPKARRATIPAYEHGVVVLRGYSAALGYYLVVRNDDNTFSGWAHLVGESRLPVGSEVWGGSIVGLAAGSDDNPGSAWSGPHIHTTHGPTAEHIYSGTVWNPTTRINRALTTPAGGTTVTPIAAPSLEEADMPFIVYTPQHGIWSVAPGECVAHVDDYIYKGLKAKNPNFVWDISPDDIDRVLYALSGVPADRIPGPGYAWSVSR